ncbi:DUF927 domain-containing protein [Mesoterricola sediminis]|uniref:DUF927 domain-containing protein n=1 Tax=Mesoterricola sediminis TaxID=2927980 RepID=A0AA48KFF4_9BACT|nr:DUF927 domain-containing protein [Mesoterricola sediminis]BDU76403.1 hypothetical protein METESE_13610 [Mesoterricola sediminis]
MDEIRTHALPFLACLLGCAPSDALDQAVTWQTFDDEKPGGERRRDLARTMHGSLREHLAELRRLNGAGAGIFVTVNGTDGRARKKENVQTLRAWWADLDSKDAREPFDAARLPLAPSMTVRTPGGAHLYWLPLEPMPGGDAERQAEHEAELRTIREALAPFGADRQVCEVARVLRVPGFMHRKAGPHLVELVTADGPRWTRDQVREAFPPPVVGAITAPPQGEPEEGMKRDSPAGRPANWRERVGAYLRRGEPSIQGQDGSRALLDAFLKVIQGFDLSEAEALELVAEHYNVPALCEPTWSMEELRHKAANAFQIAGHPRGRLWREGPKASNHGHDDHGQAGPEGGDSEPTPQDHARPRVRGFEWGPRGLFHLKAPAGKDDEGNPRPAERVWIAPPFTLPGLVRDERSTGWRLLIAWQDPDRIPHEEALPFELLTGEGAELARTMGQGGLILPPEPALRRHLLRYLCGAAQALQRGPRVRLVDALGWVPGAYVLPGGEVIGNPTEPVRYAGEMAGPQGRQVAGTLEGWREGVARFAVGNPRLAFALACAFAGPLLDMVRPDGGGGFNLMGFSSKGKSTCLEAAASVWGRPDPLPTWRATGNGLEGIAATRNDGFLALDELGQVDPREAGSVAYMLANGSAKARATREGGARTMRQWRLVFLSSGEQGLEDKMQEGGQRARAGQEVRVPDIPCPETGMFDKAHELPSLGHLAEHLKAQARAHYGQPIRAFLGRLCDAGPGAGALQARLQEMERVWLAQVVPMGADAQVRRVAGRFALVAVAGELAQGMGILPWPEGEASRAAQVCFKAWLDRRGFTGASEVHRGIEAVLDFISRHQQARFQTWGVEETVHNRAGLKRHAEGPVEGWDFFFLPSGWKEATAGFSPGSVARACAAAGILEPGADGNPSRSLKLWGIGKTRCYVVRAAGIARHIGGDDE